MTGRVAHFCTMCGSALEQRERYGKIRPICPSCGYVVFFDPKVAVVILIFKDDSLLLVKRRIDPGKGKWALPAGFVDADEDPKLAAIREVREETGLNIIIHRLLDVFPKVNDTGTADIIIAYTAHVIDGALQADDDAEAVDWFTPESLPELVFATTEILVSRWKNGEL